MNPFIQMAATLTAKTMSAWNIEPDARPKGLSRTETIRRLLKVADRPVTAEEVTWELGEELPNFGVGLVWLLLKHDISKGRITLQGGRYAWNHAYDTAEAAAIRAAVKLLRSQGYKVKEPTA